MVHRENREENTASHHSLNLASKNVSMKSNTEEPHISKYRVFKSTTIKFKVK